MTIELFSLSELIPGKVEKNPDFNVEQLCVTWIFLSGWNISWKNIMEELN